MENRIIRNCFIAMILILSACAPSYVAVQPSYTEGVRSSQPSNLHVWVNGNWIWNSRSRNYTYREGYWRVPSRGRSYSPGHWQAVPRGHHWVQGRWR